MSEALKTIYSFIWDDFCSWYLEWVKPGFEQPIDESVYNKTVYFFEQLLQLLHPFMPFITEEIYHLLKQQDDDLTVKQFEEINSADEKILAQGNILKEVITAIRDVRNKNQIKLKEKIKLHIETSEKDIYKNIENILAKQLNTETISFTKEPVGNSITVIIRKDKFYIESDQALNTGGQKEQLLKDLDYLKGFLNSVDKKLNNEKFVNNAKAEVIELERRKKEDAETKIKVIEESLSALQ